MAEESKTPDPGTEPAASIPAKPAKSGGSSHGSSMLVWGAVVILFIGLGFVFYTTTALGAGEKKLKDALTELNKTVSDIKSQVEKMQGDQKTVLSTAQQQSRAEVNRLLEQVGNVKKEVDKLRETVQNTTPPSTTNDASDSPLSFPVLVLNDGTTYKDAKITQVTPAGVTIRYQDGAVTIPINQLPTQIIRKLQGL